MVHRHIIGQSNVGKTSLQNELIHRDDAGGICVIDTSGSLIDNIRYDYLFDPSRTRWNPFDEPIDRNVAANLFADTIVDLIGHTGSDRPLWLINLKLNAQFLASAFIDGKRTLSSVSDFLFDPQFQKELNIIDPGTKQYWDFVKGMQPRERTTHISSIYSMFSSLLLDARVRHLFSSSKTKLSLAKMTDQVLLVQLPLSQYSPDAVAFIGTMVLAYLNRLCGPLSIYVDNAHLFGSQTLQSMLVEGRHRLTISHQYFDQLAPAWRLALIGNAAERYLFRISKEDARIVAPNMPPMSSKLSLDELPNHTYRSIPYDRMAPDGVTTPLET